MVIDPDDCGRKLLDEPASASSRRAITRDNYREVLTPLLTEGGGRGFCVNLSVDTSSLDIMRLCREIGAPYIDTVVEPWPGFYFDRSAGPEARTNYALRETVRAREGDESRRHDRRLLLRRQSRHGVVVRQAGAGRPRRRHRAHRLHGAAARRPRRLGAARCATSASRASTSPSATPSARRKPKPMNVFVNTWSVEGFCRRGHAAGRTRLGHPREVDAGQRSRDASAPTSRRSTCCSPAPTRACARGARRPARSTASSSPTTKSISIADYFTVRDGDDGRATGRPATTPTTRRTTPCSRCTSCSAGPADTQDEHHILDEDEIVDGIDELGVLLYGHAKNAYWYGSQLSIEETRRIAPYQNATGLQVTSAVHRRHGLGAGESRTPASSRPTRWTTAAASRCRRPTSARSRATTPTGRRSPTVPGFFPEDIDESDPWQFRNVLVH